MQFNRSFGSLNTKSAILILDSILKYRQSSYLNYLLLQIWQFRLHSQSVSLSDLEDEKLWKSLSYVIPAGHSGVVNFNPSA